jgi:hypothetical protein
MVKVKKALNWDKKKKPKEEKEMKKKAFWDNPKKTSKKLTPAQIKSAKARAKAAGRKYPNLVDNAAIARKSK